ARPSRCATDKPDDRAPSHSAPAETTLINVQSLTLHQRAVREKCIGPPGVATGAASLTRSISVACEEPQPIRCGPMKSPQPAARWAKPRISNGQRLEPNGRFESLPDSQRSVRRIIFAERMRR